MLSRVFYICYILYTNIFCLLYTIYSVCSHREVLKIRIVICDDDPVFIENTRQMICRWSDNIHISTNIISFQDGDCLTDYCFREKADIILLDIMMPLLNGMDAAKEIRKCDSNVKIIFLTSTAEFAVESYDVNASGYLLKPIVPDKLFKVLDNCVISLRKKPDTVTVRTSFGYQNILTHTIECIEAQNKKVIFTLSDGTSNNALDTLSFYEKILTYEKGFFKCHRSYIVYIPAVDHFTTAEIQTKSGMRIPIARGCGKTFQKAYFAYMFKERENDND